MAHTIQESREGTVGEILAEAWALYSKHFLLLSIVVVSVWLPLELIASYLDQ